MSGKLLVLITGANQGLGFYAAQQLSATNKHHVLMGSRDLSKAEGAIRSFDDGATPGANAANVEPIQIDVKSDSSIEAAVKAVEQRYGRLDMLMLNAGIVAAAEAATTREHYAKLYDTNVFGAVATVEAFLPLLRKSTATGGKRIAFTSSGLGSIHNSLAGQGNMSAVNFPIYRSSKTALNMILAHYACLLEEEGFVVAGSEPGYCGTAFTNFKGLKDPRDGAKVLVRAATGSKDDVHGHVVDETRKMPW